MTLIDQATTVREGESLNLRHVDFYMKRQFPSLNGELTIKQFEGGASNLTYLLQYPNREFILRRPPFGTIAKSAHNMMREANIMQALQPLFPFVPKVFEQCSDESVMGAEFYIMERLEGIIPRKDMPAELDLDFSRTRSFCLDVIDKLVELHQVDYEDAGLESIGKGEGYVARQVSGWSDRYQKSHTEDAASFTEVMAWLKEKQPEDIKSCLIHNDFRLDNLVLKPDQSLEIIGVLDWEMATIGDPLMDLGNTLAYWVQADDEPAFRMTRRQPTHLEGMLTRKEVVAYYLEKTGIKIKSFDFYEVYGLFRLAAIIQQIYYRYYHGHTSDARFKDFVTIGRYLEKRCLGLIENSNL